VSALRSGVLPGGFGFNGSFAGRPLTITFAAHIGSVRRWLTICKLSWGKVYRYEVTDLTHDSRFT